MPQNLDGFTLYLSKVEVGYEMRFTLKDGLLDFPERVLRRFDGCRRVARKRPEGLQRLGDTVSEVFTRDLGPEQCIDRFGLDGERTCCLRSPAPPLSRTIALYAVEQPSPKYKGDHDGSGNK